MSEKVGQIYALIPKIMLEVGAVEKNRVNKPQGYSFRGIDDFYLALQIPMASNGVFVVPKVLEHTREERETKSGGRMIYTIMKVSNTYYAPDGSSMETITVGEAMDSGDKSANKAMSAAQKYSFIQLFCVPSDDDKDTENHSHELAAPKNASLDRPVGNPIPRSRTPEDVELIQNKIDAAFHQSGIAPSVANSAQLFVLKRDKITGLNIASDKWIDGFIAAIRNGKFDKFDPAKVAPHPQQQGKF